MSGSSAAVLMVAASCASAVGGSATLLGLLGRTGAEAVAAAAAAVSAEDTERLAEGVVAYAAPLVVAFRFRADRPAVAAAAALSCRRAA